jgi:hypothetical protein
MFASIRQFLMSARGGKLGQCHSLVTGLVFVLVAWGAAAQPAAAQAPPKWPFPFPESAITASYQLHLDPHHGPYSGYLVDNPFSQIQFNSIKVWRALPTYSGNVTLSRAGTFPTDVLIIEATQLGQCVLEVPRDLYHVVYGHLMRTGTVTEYLLVEVLP